MAYLLLIDDDDFLIPQQVRRALPDPDSRLEVAGTGAAALEIIRIDARIPVIFITMAKKADAAIEAMKQGAYDYLFKPLELNQLRRVVGEALEVARRMRTPTVITERPPDSAVDGDILGGSAVMCEV